MKRYRWSIILSVSNLLLAALLFVLGQREFKSLARSPGAFYEGSVGYTPTAQKLSYCLNAPSLVISAPIRHWLMGHVVVGGFWVTYGDIEYFITVFLFWWWFGLKIRDNQRPELRTAIKAVERVTALLLSLTLLYASITGLFGRSMVPRSILISMALWGLGLLYYVSIRPDGKRKSIGDPVQIC